MMVTNRGADAISENSPDASVPPTARQRPAVVGDGEDRVGVGGDDGDLATVRLGGRGGAFDTKILGDAGEAE